jgi:hypothetical protein
LDPLEAPKVSKIKYTTNISLRDYPEFKDTITKNDQKKDPLGCYIALILDQFNGSLKTVSATNELDIYKKEWIRNFWKHAANETITLHRNIKRNDIFYPLKLPVVSRQQNDSLFHFGNSNLGQMPASITDKKLIKMKHCFATGKYTANNKFSWFNNLIVTVDGELCWTISYNSNFIKNEIMDLIIENIIKIMSITMKQVK